MAGAAVNPVALLSASSVHFVIIPLWSEYTVDQDSSSSRGSSSLPLLLYHTKHGSTHQPPLVPLRSLSCPPFSRDPCDLCSVTAQREDPMLRLPRRWPWRAPVRHTHTHSSTDTLAYTLRQRRAIDILLYRGWRGGGREGARRVALQWAHCRDTGEIRERVRVWVCLSERVTERERVCLRVCVCVRERERERDSAFVIGQRCQKVFVFLTPRNMSYIYKVTPQSTRFLL